MPPTRKARSALARLIHLIMDPTDRYALGRTLQVADLGFEILGQAFQPLPNGLVPEAPSELAVAIGEPSQIDDVVHRDSRYADGSTPRPWCGSSRCWIF